MQVKKQQLELDMAQRTGSKLGKEYVKKKKKKSYSGFIKIPGTRIPTPAFRNKVKDWSFKLLLAAEIFPLNRLYRTGIENKSESEVT